VPLVLDAKSHRQTVDHPKVCCISTTQAAKSRKRTGHGRYAKKVLEGTVEDITFHSCIYEAPLDADMGSIETGRLANPSLGITIPESVYLTAHKEAVATGKIANFRRRMLNQWIKDETHWIQPYRWDACSGEIDEKRLEDLPCWLGVDMSCCDDFTAMVKVWKDEETNEHFVKARFWLPEPTFRERVQKGLGSLQQWQLDGWVELIDAPAIEPDEIEAAIRQECDANPNVKEIAFDMAMAKTIITHLDREGYIRSLRVITR
jgi:phage terminase large subunit-like protein